MIHSSFCPICKLIRSMIIDNPDKLNRIKAEVHLARLHGHSLVEAFRISNEY